MKKYLVILSISLLAAACGSKQIPATVSQNQSATSTNNQSGTWNKYTSSQYGFSFSYPNILVPTEPGDHSALVYLGKNGSNELTVNVGDGNPVGGGSYTKGVVAGKTAYFKQSGAENSSTDLVLVPFMYGGKQYTLFLSFNYSKPAASNDAISYRDQILGSFKFAE